MMPSIEAGPIDPVIFRRFATLNQRREVACFHFLPLIQPIPACLTT